jgi:methyl-accepting chemotaxis protein
VATELSMRTKKIFLVNRDFQLRYTRAAIGVGILSTILTAVVILYPLYAFEILRIASFLPVPILATMAFACLINMTFLGAMGIIVTHKMAGPMYSLVRHFRVVAMGRFTEPMRLREDDELKFVVRNFNEMVEELKGAALIDVQILDDLLVKIAVCNSDSDRGFAIEAAEKLKRRLEARVEPNNRVNSNA